MIKRCSIVFLVIVFMLTCFCSCGKKSAKDLTPKGYIKTYSQSEIETALYNSLTTENSKDSRIVFSIYGEYFDEDTELDYYVFKWKKINVKTNKEELIDYIFVSHDISKCYIGTYNEKSGQAIFSEKFELKI